MDTNTTATAIPAAEEVLVPPTPELLAEANKFYDDATDKPLALKKYPFLLQTRPEYAHQRK